MVGFALLGGSQSALPYQSLPDAAGFMAKVAVVCPDDIKQRAGTELPVRVMQSVWGHAGGDSKVSSSSSRMLGRISSLKEQ